MSTTVSVPPAHSSQNADPMQAQLAAPVKNNHCSLWYRPLMSVLTGGRKAALRLQLLKPEVTEIAHTQMRILVGFTSRQRESRITKPAPITRGRACRDWLLLRLWLLRINATCCAGSVWTLGENPAIFSPMTDNNALPPSLVARYQVNQRRMLLIYRDKSCCNWVL